MPLRRLKLGKIAFQIMYRKSIQIRNKLYRVYSYTKHRLLLTTNQSAFVMDRNLDHVIPLGKGKKICNSIETCKDGIFITDMNGNITECNQTYADMLGYPRDELIGLSHHQLTPETWQPMEKKIVEEQLLKRGFTDEYKKEYVKKNGAIFPVSLRGWLIQDAMGESSGLWGIVNDITTLKLIEKEMKKSENYRKTIFENSRDGMIVINNEGFLTDFNRAFVEMLGYSPEELRAFSMVDITPKEYADIDKESMEAILDRGYFDEYEKEFIRKDGSRVHVRSHGTLIGDTSIRQSWRAVLFVKDVTEWKRIQEELVVKDRLATIGRLASVASHELRNPLGVIKNVVYYLETKFGKDMDKKMAQQLEIIDGEVDRCVSVVRDVLECAKGPRPPKLQRVDMNNMVQKTLARVEVPETIRTVVILGEHPEFLADPEMILRVLLNLISNALDAMVDSGVLTVKTRLIDDHIEVLVTDTGIGISKEIMEKIFTPMFSTKVSGTGLGLYITRNIVRAHGGSIFVESKVAKGSTFTVRLPVSNRL